MCYLFVQLIRHPLPGFTHGTWSGYWAATDTVVAVAISFAPLAADYTRHSRSPRAAFAGAMAGYSATQVLCYVIGLLALVTVLILSRVLLLTSLGPDIAASRGVPVRLVGAAFLIAVVIRRWAPGAGPQSCSWSRTSAARPRRFRSCACWKADILIAPIRRRAGSGHSC